MQPIFVDIRNELDRVHQETKVLKQAWTRFVSERESVFADPVLHWMAISAIGSGIEKVYSGIERILKMVASDIDSSVPRDEAWHKTLLQRMASDLPGIRPPVIRKETLAKLDGLRSFRHRVRYSYIADLDESRLLSIAEDTFKALPEFEKDLTEFRNQLDPQHESG